MSDRMKVLGFKGLVEWIVEEYERIGSVFGIPEGKFYRPHKSHKSFLLFNEPLETPFGPAAGPHTQLAQNILCSYLTGARFIELKTVQVIDSLEFKKPCIDAFDEGYNTEWSQELSLEDSLDEYIKAWVLIHILKEHFRLSDSLHNPGFMFNMSVGYDLKGIQSEKMERFIEGMLNPKRKIEAMLSVLEGVHPELVPRTVSERMIRSVTISTMHGCPPEEIESMAQYLIRDKGLNTYVKLNPTLLGRGEVARILRSTGFDYISLKEETFEKDLQYPDAVALIKNLTNFARSFGAEFGVKLSNTLASINFDGLLPGEEKYMSGRALFPLTIQLACKLASEFEGRINISYAGGASLNNVEEIVGAGLFPVTICTDALKPGGYLRFYQIAQKLLAGSCSPLLSTRKRTWIVDPEKLMVLAEKSLTDTPYQKKGGKTNSLKVESKLAFFDCIIAPCVAACPIHQDVPEYIDYIENTDYTNSLKTILKKNPLPNITGYICDHTCVQKCVRGDYDNQVYIRDLKRIAAQRGNEGEIVREIKKEIKTKQKSTRVAIIGSGPAGLASGFFIAREGFKVTVFETRDKPGGTVRYAIPRFRLPDSVIDRDVSIIRKIGVDIKTGSSPDYSIEKLKAEGYDYVIISTGCGKARDLDIGAQTGNQGYYTGIDFLERVKKGENLFVGKKVLVVGGGNSAVDAARTALRFSPDFVCVVYRRDLQNMPADREEIDSCFEEGIEIKELLGPEELITEDGRIIGLKCKEMKLGLPDESGRKRPIPVKGSTVMLEADTLIAAIGEEVEVDFLKKNRIDFERGNRIEIDEVSGETNVFGVYGAGDCVRGPATVVEAIADAKKIALSIFKKEKVPVEDYLFDRLYREVSEEKLKKSSLKHGNVCSFYPVEKLPLHERDDKRPVIKTLREKDAVNEAHRCLQCTQICNKCIETCPNRANISFRIEPFFQTVPVLHGSSRKAGIKGMRAPLLKDLRIDQNMQILHIDDFCNECGNCETFCPHKGRPYRDKYTLFSGHEMFEKSQNSGFYLMSSSEGVKYKYWCRVHDLIFKMVIDSRKGEVSFIADRFSILFKKQKEDRAFYLKKYTYSGPGELDTRAMLGLYLVIESVISSSPYLFNVEKEL